MENNYYQDYLKGLKKGLPIGLGYLPVSFTFGIMAVNGNLPIWLAIFISMSNLTSAGQFAGTNLIISSASFLEIGITTFVINIRYMLMSLSLSQKIDEKMPIYLRSILAFGITDETFTIASIEKGQLSFQFILGLISMPYLGWSLGTIIGAITCSHLPKVLQDSMGIALYTMFIAIVVPASKKSKAALTVSLSGVILSTLLTYLPMINKHISSGFKIVIATIIASTIGAYLFPLGGDEI